MLTPLDFWAAMFGMWSSWLYPPTRRVELTLVSENGHAPFFETKIVRYL
jgi:hypothetical protein